MFGKKDWFFPDAELPPMGPDPELYGHESIIILNPNETAANVSFVLHRTDRAPEKPVTIAVEPGRVRCERATAKRGLLGIAIPEGEQYAIALHSDIPIVAQYGRLDLRLGNMAFYTTPGYCE